MLLCVFLFADFSTKNNYSYCENALLARLTQVAFSAFFFYSTFSHYFFVESFLFKILANVLNSPGLPDQQQKKKKNEVYSTRVFNGNVARFICRETPVVESKVTEKVVEDVEDTPVVASGEETETVAPAEDAPATTTTTTEEAVPAVESTAEVVEASENGNGDAEVVEPVVEEVGEFVTLDDTILCNDSNKKLPFFLAEESVKRKAADIEAPEVPEKKVKTDDAEAVVEAVEEVVA